jgi:hypothetical protein
MALLEQGEVLELKDRPFMLEPQELQLLDPAISNGRSKNVSFDSATGRMGGIAVDGASLEAARGMMARFAVWSEELLDELLPAYAGSLQRARTSFRPAPVEQRPQSPRHDDRRLHVDAFPKSPTQGRRILRLFSNIDPEGRPRQWRLGEPFEAFAQKFAGRIPPQPPGQALALLALGLTRGRRTAYDHAMLQLHDLGKLDEDYQRACPSHEASFASGATWIVFTDAALHAALAGQHCLEQTFLLPVEAMQAPEKSPLRILERLTGRRLV